VSAVQDNAPFGEEERAVDGDQTADTKLPQPGRIVWPKPNPAVEAAMPQFTLRELIAASPDPIAFEPRPRSEYFLGGLFAHSDLLRFFTTSQAVPRTDSIRDCWRVFQQYPQMLPSPLPSRQKEALPEQRKYIVVRFLQGSLDDHARRIWHMAQTQALPLVMVTFDAARSLEAWFRCEGVPKGELKEWFTAACLIGAEHNGWNMNAPVRTPDALRLSNTRESYAALRRAGIKEFVGLDGLRYPRREHVFFYSPQ
jgi:hypothetical protein